MEIWGLICAAFLIVSFVQWAITKMSPFYDGQYVDPRIGCLKMVIVNTFGSLFYQGTPRVSIDLDRKCCIILLYISNCAFE